MPYDATQPGGGNPDKALLRANFAALEAVVGALIAQHEASTLAGTGKALMAMDDAATPEGALPLDDEAKDATANWAALRELTLQSHRFKIVSLTLSAGAAEMDPALGRAFHVEMTENIAANGITVAAATDDHLHQMVLRLRQDVTGSRLIGGGTTVNAGFSSSVFDFGGRTIQMPSTAGSWIKLQIDRWGVVGEAGDEKWNVREHSRSA